MDAVKTPPFGSQQDWWGRSDDPTMSLAQSRKDVGVFNYRIPTKIAELSVDLPTELAADAEDALASLVKFDLYSLAKLQVSDPIAGPMLSVLLRAESASSSRIENLSVSARQLAMQELGLGRSANGAMVLANVQAMQVALQQADQITPEAILSIHRALLASDPALGDKAGAFRQEPVWIGGSWSSPVTAEYVAPPADQVAELVYDLTRFLDRDDLPLLAQIAIAHAQFEGIHPFPDGNGRTGRALVHIFLRNRQVTAHTVAPVSAGLLTSTAQYFSALAAYREGDAAPIITAFCDSARYAASNGLRLVTELNSEIEKMKSALGDVRSDSSVHRIPVLLLANPVITTQVVAEKLSIDESNALRSLQMLTTKGILTTRNGPRHLKLWQSDRLLTTLENFGRSTIRA